MKTRREKLFLGLGMIELVIIPPLLIRDILKHGSILSGSATIDVIFLSLSYLFILVVVVYCFLEIKKERRHEEKN